MGNVSGYGGNLTYPVRPYLFNSISAKDFGYYTMGGVKYLIAKKLGIQIPYVANKTVKTVITPLPGEFKSMRLVVNPVCPCEDCNYEYGIGIIRKVKRPGIGNSDYYPTSRFYGDKLFRIGTCSNGILAAADITTIENTIMSQINADLGGGMENSTPGIVDAKRYYIVNDTDATDASVITVTHGGSDVTVTTTGGFGNMDTVFNAQSTVNQKLVCYKIGATQYLITSIDAGYAFSVAGTTAAAVAEKGLLITAKSKDVQFEIEAQPGVFEVKGGISFAKITPVSWESGVVTMKVDGESLTATLATNIATSVTAINAALAATAVRGYATAFSTTSAVIALLPTKNKLIVSMLPAAGTVNYNHSSKASYPFFTPDDVFVEFSQLRHMGDKLSLVHDVKPLKDQEYVKINISHDMSGHGNMHGASHGNDYRQGYTFYILKSEYDSATDKWDATNYMWDADDSGFTADKDFKEMLAAWYS